MILMEILCLDCIIFCPVTILVRHFQFFYIIWMLACTNMFTLFTEKHFFVFYSWNGTNAKLKKKNLARKICFKENISGNWISKKWEKRIKYFSKRNTFSMLILKHPIWSSLWDGYELIIHFKYKADWRHFWNVLQLHNSKIVSVYANRYFTYNSYNFNRFILFFI